MGGGRLKKMSSTSPPCPCLFFLYNSLFNVVWGKMNYSRIKSKQEEEIENILFLPPYPYKSPRKQVFTLGNSAKLCDTLKIPRSKIKTHGNFTSFLLDAWNFHSFFQYSWKFHVLNPSHLFGFFLE